MLMPASSEFVDLCRSQVELLTGLGAALSIVYLTEELTELSDTTLVPIVAYPEAVANWDEGRLFSLLANGRNRETPRQLPAVTPSAEQLAAAANLIHPLQAAEQALLRQQQVVLPLVQDEVVMGLLITARADRDWTEAEQAQIRQIAATLALAGRLDQRAQWVAQDLHQQDLLHDRQQDALDDLLHQFRNPLTALRTFGKLLLKRLRPGDTNRSVAESIVRESDRLQELLQQLDNVIAWDETNLHRLAEAAQPEAADNAYQRSLPAPNPSPSTISPSDRTLPSTTLPASSSAANPPLLPSAALFNTSLQVTPCRVREVLSPLLQSAIAIAQDRQLDLHIDLPDDLPPVWVDPRALREVLTNLVDNALKYTPAGGQVYVGVQASTSPERSNRQAILIADTGPGIPLADQVHLFERRFRGIQSQSAIPGTGLGLAIARELVQQMQGEIQIFSPAATTPLLATASLAMPEDCAGTAVVVWLPEVAAEGKRERGS